MKRVLLSIGLLLSGSFLMGQGITDESVMLVVGKDTTTRGKFIKTYLQNSISGRDSKLDRKDLENYLQMYINFRLKVEAAKDASYDTVTYLRDELEHYKNELADPYLVDQETLENLYKEIYDNMHYDVNVRHILLPLPMYSSPEDTLSVYNRAVSIRDQILKGADFADMVIRYSADYRKRPGVEMEKTGREGELGYFSSMSMVYPFEKAVYSMKVGEISMPVRTKFGYHLIQLLDKKLALGKVGASHIMVMYQNPADRNDTARDAKALIEQAYAELQQGADFGEVAKKYSDDKYSAARGGSLGVFNVNRMVPEVVAPLYGLQVGSYSKPVESRFGWHIVRLDSKTGVNSYEDEKHNIEYSVKNDDERSALAMKALEKKLLEEYPAEVDLKLLKKVRSILPDTITRSTVPLDSASDPDFYASTLVKYRDYKMSVYEALDLAKGLTDRRLMVPYVDGWFNEMIENCKGAAAIRHRMHILEDLYPEYKELVEEYKDGIYLFDINNREVWAKAIVDSAGLEVYYEQNKDKYMSERKVVAVICSYDVTKAETKDVRKLVSKAAKKGWSVAQIRKEADSRFGSGVIRVDSAAYAAGENVFMDNVEWKKGLTKDILSGTSKKAFAIIEDIEEPRQRDLEEVRGTVVSDYQGYLELQWLKELKEKYPVTVSEDVFESLFQK